MAPFPNVLCLEHLDEGKSILSNAHAYRRGPGVAAATYGYSIASAAAITLFYGFQANKLQNPRPTKS